MKNFVHIYGFAVKNEYIEVKKPAKLFKLPFYGDNEDEEEKMHYIGIILGKQLNPFDRLCIKQSGTFQMSNVHVCSGDIELMNKLYPVEDLKCHSFLLNVYTSHYYSGNIMIGYFFSPDKDYKLTQTYVEDSDEESVDHTKLNIFEIINENIKDINVVKIAHTIQNAMGEFFIGKILSPEFENFDFSHEYEPGNKFYQMAHTTYNFDDYKNFNLTFKNGYISSNKTIGFIPTMCYCCT